MSTEEDKLRRWRMINTLVKGSMAGDVPNQLVDTFAAVCLNPGSGPRELARITGASESTMSRHLLELSDKSRSGGPGFKLLQRGSDPTDMRAVVYTLTRKGQVLKNAVLELFGD